MRNRVPIGIDGVDSMIFGGIPEGNQVVLAGGPGDGKTLFGFEFLYRGAMKGEPGVLFSLEEHPDMIIENAKEAFGELAEIDRLIADNKLVIYDTADIRAYLKNSSDVPRYSFGKLVSDLEAAIAMAKARRLVFDSLSLIKLLIESPLDYRNISVDLMTALRRFDVTSLLTVEVDVADRSRLFFQPEFFMYDGIISMYSGETDGENRMLTLEVIKMRGSKHSRATVPYEITPKGFDVSRKGD